MSTNEGDVTMPPVKKFQGGIGLAVAILVAEAASQLLGYEPNAVVVSATAYIFAYVAKEAGLKVEE